MLNVAIQLENQFLWSQQSSQSEQLSKPRPLHENVNLAPLNPSPILSTVNDQSSAITSHHSSHSSHGKFESSNHQPVAFVDSIKITFTSPHQNTLLSSSSFSVSDSYGKDGSMKRLITPRTGDRRSRTPPINHTEQQKSSKSEEIEIVELQTVGPKDAKRTSLSDGKATRSNKSNAELFTDDLRVVVLQAEEKKTVCVYIE